MGTALALGAAIAGTAVAVRKRRQEKKKHSSGGGAVAATTTETEEEERSAREKEAGEGGESPFDGGALGVSAKKRKLNTLIGGYSSGALAGSGEGSTTLG